MGFTMKRDETVIEAGGGGERDARCSDALFGPLARRARVGHAACAWQIHTSADLGFIS